MGMEAASSRDVSTDVKPAQVQNPELKLFRDATNYLKSHGYVLDNTELVRSLQYVANLANEDWTNFSLQSGMGITSEDIDEAILFAMDSYLETTLWAQSLNIKNI